MKKYVLKVLGGVMITSVLISSLLTSYLAGLGKGVEIANSEVQSKLEEVLNQEVSSTTKPKEVAVKGIKAASTPKPAAAPVVSSWGGPQLWDAVNQRRSSFGVNGLSQIGELCTIASIRLNQILQAGTLDGHEGFSKLRERPDLKPTFDKYNLSEFLVSGASSPQNAVSLWENSMGHKQLLTGGQYVWGCIYAQAGFGVAIAAY